MLGIDQINTPLGLLGIHKYFEILEKIIRVLGRLVKVRIYFVGWLWGMRDGIELLSVDRDSQSLFVNRLKDWSGTR